MTTALKEFLRCLKLNRNVSPHTGRAYESDLSQFLAHAAAAAQIKVSALTPEQLDRTAIRGFLAEMHKRGQARATSARKLAALRTFLRISAAKVCSKIRARSWRRQSAVRMPAHLSETDVALIAAPADSPLGRRDHAITGCSRRPAPQRARGPRRRRWSRQRWSACLARAARSLIPFNGSTDKAIARTQVARAGRRRAEGAQEGRREGWEEADRRRPDVRQLRAGVLRWRRRRLVRRHVASCNADGDQPARAAAFVRTPAPAWCRPSGIPGTARPLAPQHHSDTP